MKERSYSEILAELLDKFGPMQGDTERTHRRWRHIASGAKTNAAWMVGSKYV